MDLSFFRRAEARFAGRSPARLDYRVLVATLATMQSASPAARAAAGTGEGSMISRHGPLVELLLGGPSWREAVAAQAGCFNQAQAAFAGKGV
jgi:hypothetical protein